ncbi:PREDICTED: uncharacterized protein LOC109181502 isoform X1 [Ipomoea nil]|uniref:uncharacterized protein LOC109181502 isoform X1 n=2 Tax=Ipomoea nil TaxID=35883 RepID=UPI000901B40E|nr:PREDICTED: uncharacterized protein LOC109181502 isoform X1 [Ipomoea nil]XP_019186848.1 PREDICTED: uncharacterized protein LOC109181502 isoform X1 [Ipomoea nil]XP_019186849.1 PREDICTED: uncharacterized protein LOC109181502 isoform X1 [Ipomoea nil]
MGEKGDISEYRSRLDKTLSCHDLVNEEALKGLVRNQILSSSNFEMEGCIDNVVERRTEELGNTLGMLRSASLSDEWKVKQDSEEFRVMYREGPEGTPFHTLLVEGYVDGPIDVCMCISWEADLYKKWWPQTSVPCFKIAYSQCLQKVRIGEQISLVRMKLSWPLSTREALVHYFEFDYFQDGLIVVLLNSISDLENVDTSTHGFARDGIPDARDVVRIDVVGGLALQKVTANRSYFRTIANMDIKLDFVPPAFINFVSRQLIGGGFKLYKKEVASVCRGDEDFSEALKGVQYKRIREALYSDIEVEGVKRNNDIQTNDTDENEIQEEEVRDCVTGNRNICGEIEEVDEEDGGKAGTVDEDTQNQDSPRNQILQGGSTTRNKKIAISPEVQQALATLEKAISFIRENRCNSNFKSMCRSNIEDSKFSGFNQIYMNGTGTTTEISRKESVEITSYEHRISSCSHSSRRTSSSLCTKETSHNKIAPVSPDAYVADPNSHSCGDHEAGETILENIEKDNNLTASHVNHIKEDRTGKRKTRKLSYCCYSLLSRQIST